VRERLQGVNDDPSILHADSTLGTFIDVCAKRGDAEAGFAVDQ
jgi:hypothetical protein